VTLPLVRGTTSVAKRLLIAYLLLFFGYNLLPLDLTVSPVEIYHKWRQGKVIWLPFSAQYGSRAQQAYDILSDIAIWVPVAALWRLADRKPALQVWTITLATAALLEFLQLFVFSRVTDITDVFTAAIGAALGTFLVRSRGDAQHQTSSWGPQRTLPWLGGVALWLGVLAVVFWYPFDFNLDRSFLRNRVQGLGRVPFEAYYYGTEFRAITEVLHKTLFMAPLGVLLYRLGTRLPATWPPALMHSAATLLIAAVALGIEAGQLLLPSKNADATDWLLESLGGLLGYVGSLAIAGKLQPESARSIRHD
jgi:glycopeptide antibiotics resistance protein